MSIIFISHSRKDTSLVSNIRQILVNVGHRPIIEEFIPEDERKAVPHDEIASKMSLCDAVFLFLTDNVLSTDHTRNWVVFEVGLARDSSKRVFVFERQGVPISYPIPYVTDYMIFDPKGIDDLLTIQKIAKRQLASRVPAGWVGAGAGALMGTVFGPLGMGIGAIAGGLVGYGADLQAGAGIPTVECPDCHIRFQYYSPNISHFNCPACRQSITLAVLEK